MPMLPENSYSYLYMKDLFPEDFLGDALQAALNTIYYCGNIEESIKTVAGDHGVAPMSPEEIAGVVSRAWDTWNNSERWTVREGRAVPDEAPW